MEIKALPDVPIKHQRVCHHLHVNFRRIVSISMKDEFVLWSINTQSSPTSMGGSKHCAHFSQPALDHQINEFTHFFLYHHTSERHFPINQWRGRGGYLCWKYLASMLHNTDINVLLQKLVPVEFCAMFRQDNGREGQLNKMLKPLNVYIINIYLWKRDTLLFPECHQLLIA